MFADGDFDGTEDVASEREGVYTEEGLLELTFILALCFFPASSSSARMV